MQSLVLGKPLLWLLLYKSQTANGEIVTGQSCATDDTDCTIICSGTGCQSTTINCPTTIDCNECIINCTSTTGCFSTTFNGNNCKNMIVNAMSTQTLQFEGSVIKAPGNGGNLTANVMSGVGTKTFRDATFEASYNTGSMKINCDSSDITEECKLMTVNGTYAENLEIQCIEASCEAATVYCPNNNDMTNGHWGKNSCLFNCTSNGIANNQCKDANVYAYNGYPNDLTWVCQGGDNTYCKTADIWCQYSDNNDPAGTYSDTCAWLYNDTSLEWYCNGGCHYTHEPTMIPSINPSRMPTNNPSVIPSNYPTQIPSINPTHVPTAVPTTIPTTVPTTTTTTYTTMQSNAATTTMTMMMTQTTSNNGSNNTGGGADNSASSSSASSSSSSSTGNTNNNENTMSTTEDNNNNSDDNNDNEASTSFFANEEAILYIIIAVLIGVICLICCISLMLCLFFQSKRSNQKISEMSKKIEILSQVNSPISLHSQSGNNQHSYSNLPASVLNTNHSINLLHTNQRSPLNTFDESHNNNNNNNNDGYGDGPGAAAGDEKNDIGSIAINMAIAASSPRARGSQHSGPGAHGGARGGPGRGSAVSPQSHLSSLLNEGQKRNSVHSNKNEDADEGHNNNNNITGFAQNVNLDEKNDKPPRNNDSNNNDDDDDDDDDEDEDDNDEEMGYVAPANDDANDYVNVIAVAPQAPNPLLPPSQESINEKKMDDDDDYDDNYYNNNNNNIDDIDFDDEKDNNNNNNENENENENGQSGFGLNLMNVNAGMDALEDDLIEEMGNDVKTIDGLNPNNDSDYQE